MSGLVMGTGGQDAGDITDTYQDVVEAEKYQFDPARRATATNAERSARAREKYVKKR